MKLEKYLVLFLKNNLEWMYFNPVFEYYKCCKFQIPENQIPYITLVIPYGKSAS